MIGEIKMKYMLKHRAIGLTILTLVGYSIFINDSNNLNSKEIVLANNNQKQYHLIHYRVKNSYQNII